MLVKDYKPKYKVIEFIDDSDHKSLFEIMFSTKLMKWNDVVKRYGDYTVRSVRDYDSTRTTSVIVEKKETA